MRMQSIANSKLCNNSHLFRSRHLFGTLRYLFRSHQPTFGALSHLFGAISHLAPVWPSYRTPNPFLLAIFSVRPVIFRSDGRVPGPGGPGPPSHAWGSPPSGHTVLSSAIFSDASPILRSLPNHPFSCWQSFRFSRPGGRAGGPGPPARRDVIPTPFKKEVRGEAARLRISKVLCDKVHPPHPPRWGGVCGAVWCGAVWCGVACGAVRCCVWCGVIFVWCGVVWCGVWRGAYGVAGPWSPLKVFNLIWGMHSVLGQNMPDGSMAAG